MIAFSGHGLQATPLGPGDWPLVCFSFQGAYYTDISLPFGLHWVATHCKDVSSVITREINRKGAAVISYIDALEV